MKLLPAYTKKSSFNRWGFRCAQIYTLYDSHIFAMNEKATFGPLSAPSAARCNKGIEFLPINVVFKLHGRPPVLNPPVIIVIAPDPGASGVSEQLEVGRV